MNKNRIEGLKKAEMTSSFAAPRMTNTFFLLLKHALSKKPRRNHAPAFKAKIALEALKGDQTTVALAQRYQVRSTEGSRVCSSYNDLVIMKKAAYTYALMWLLASAPVLYSLLLVFHKTAKAFQADLDTLMQTCNIASICRTCNAGCKIRGSYGNIC